MIYLNAFIVCGVICAVGQLIIEYTKLTPAHVNTFLVIVGAFLSMVGVYDKLIGFSEAGASVPITNFGHILFKGAYLGLKNNGITGLLNGILASSSGGLTITIISAFLISLIFKPKQ